MNLNRTRQKALWTGPRRASGLGEMGWLLALALVGAGLVRSSGAETPALTVTPRDGESVTLTWEHSEPGYVIQESDSPSSIGIWRGMGVAPTSSGNSREVVRSLPSGAQRWFFRLRPRGALSAMDYLLATQDSSGAWSPGSSATVRETASAIEALHLFGLGAVSVARGASALQGLAARNHDDLARRATTLARLGQDASGDLTQLLAGQNAAVSDPASVSYPGLGWGLAAGFGNSTLDTALVEGALRSGGRQGGLAVGRETVAVGGTTPVHPFSIAAGASDVVLLVHTISGARVRFILTPPGSPALTVDLDPRTTPIHIAPLPNTPGLWTLRVQNLGGVAATYSAELGFTGSDGFDYFRLTTPLIYLARTQNPDGGWGIGVNQDSHLMITAEVLRNLADVGDAFVAPGIRSLATAWLQGRQNADGGFSSVSGASNLGETVMAMNALKAASPGTSLASAANFLRNAQGYDGSWGSNPFLTAAAIKALVNAPHVEPIPGQTVSDPTPFAAIALDDYVADADHADSELVWTVTGNSQLTLSIVDRVVTVTYPAGASLSEDLTFTATDPDGLSTSTVATFTVSFVPNQPPVVSTIPGQSVVTPDLFSSIALDDFVADPGNPDSQITWTITGNTLLSVNIANRVATITYPPGTSSSITETLTFTATDPGGLSDSTSSSFSVVYQSIDHVIAAGGLVDDSGTISAPETVWSRAANVTSSYTAPPWLHYAISGLSFDSATELRIAFRITVDAGAPAGTITLQVDHQVLDAGNIPLGPLTGNIFTFRIQVTP